MLANIIKGWRGISGNDFNYFWDGILGEDGTEGFLICNKALLI